MDNKKENFKGAREKIKAVFFDVDGTLLSFKTHKIPDSALDAINQLRSRGIKIIVATGRPLFLLDTVKHIPFDAFLTLNGSYCFTNDNKDIFKSPFDAQEIEKIIDWTNNNGKDVPFAFMHSNGWFISSINEDVKELCRHLDVEIPPPSPVENARNYEIFQTMGFFGEDYDSHMRENVLTGSELARWSPVFTDIVKAGNSKSLGMEKILNHFGLKEENSMAFGDGGNDITILKAASIGVAMGNAADNVKAIADYVTTSVDDNGIANALRYFGMID